jgi:DNA-directed RNA polymerase subunit RPC12/RpoP
MSEQPQQTPEHGDDLDLGFDAEGLDQARKADVQTRREARCHHCGSSNIRRSNSDGFVDKLYRLIGRRPYRCRDCRERFHGSRWLLHED